MEVKTLETEGFAKKLYNRWRKRIFANDEVSYRPSDEGADYWDVVLTRGKYEFRITLPPDVYQCHNLMLKADNEMRYMLKSKECV